MQAVLRTDCRYAAASQVLVTAACLAALVDHGARELEGSCNRDRRVADSGLLHPDSHESSILPRDKHRHLELFLKCTKCRRHCDRLSATLEASTPAHTGRFVRALRSPARSVFGRVWTLSFTYDAMDRIVVILFTSVRQHSSRTYLDATRRQGSQADHRRFADQGSSSLLGMGNVDAIRCHTLTQLLPVSQMTEDHSVSPQADDFGQNCVFFYFQA